MTELLEEPVSNESDIKRLLGIAYRRRLTFLMALFGGWLLVWGASWIMRPHYLSGALIMVQQPTMSENSVSPNAAGDFQLRMESITQQILSRTRLLEIIDKFQLYGKSANQNGDEKVDLMRKDINVELVRDSKKENITAFRIAYTASDPHLAQAVTADLANLFIAENLESGEKEAQGTTAFLQQQLDDARAALAAQEDKVQKFEAQHVGDLPSQQTSNIQILSGLQGQLQNEQDALNTAKQQGVYLQAMLQQERAAASRTVSAGGPGETSGEPADLAAIDRQLDTMRSQLADLKSRYTDRYPDVENLKNQITQTEATRAQLVAAMKQTKAQPNAADTPAGDSTVSAAVGQLQSQLKSNQVEIANRENAITELKARINDYQGRLNLEPLAEQQLADLSRGYEQSKANYDDLVKKSDQSQMANSMEQMQQTDRFVMLDPPLLPSKPESPNHLKFCGIGFGVGLLLGFFAAALSEFLDDRLHNEEEIKSFLPIAILSEIPQFVNSSDEATAHKISKFEYAATAAAGVVMLAGAVFSYFHG